MDDARDRVRLAITRADRRGGDVSDLLRAATAATLRAIPADGWCASTLDPLSAIKTGGVHESGLPLESARRVVDLEYGGDDVNLFADLARDRVRAAITTGTRERSARFREILRPAGYGHELRLVLLDRDRAWGGLVLLRESTSRPFTHNDRRLAAELASIIAPAVRRAVLAERPGVTRLPPHPGLILLDRDYRVRTITPGTAELLSGLVDGSATLDTVPTAVHAVAARSFVTTVADPVTAQARSRDGGWITLHGWRLDDSTHVAVAVERSRSEAVATMLLEGYALSRRERQVARLVISGYATRRIADELFLSVHTVRDHLKSIFTKTGVHSRRELVAELSGHRG